MNWTDILSATITLFLVMDSFGNIPVFHSVLSNLDQRRRTLVIVRELFIALFILLLFLFAGNHIMNFLGLTQPSLSIAGGVLLFIISLRMIFPPSRDTDEKSLDDEPFIVPLAMPLVAGPSTIAILLLLSSNQPDQLFDWTIALIIAWLGTTLLLVSSAFLMRVIGNRGSRALERLMGMILVILATQMLLDGIKAFITSL